MGFEEDLNAFEPTPTPQPTKTKVVTGDFARALAPKFTKGTSFEEDLTNFMYTQDTGNTPAKRVILHDNEKVKKAEQAPRSFMDDLNDFEHRDEPELDDDYRKKSPSFGRAALYVLGAEENATIAGIRSTLGKKPHGDYLENTYSNLFKEMGASDSIYTEALGVVVSIATAPSTYLTFGTGAALKLAKGVALTGKGLKLANAVAKDRLEEVIAQKAAKGVTLSQDAVNTLAKDTKAQVERELVTKFEKINGSRRALKKDVKGLPDNIFDLGGIKWMGHSLVDGKTVAKVAEESGLNKLGTALAETKVGQGVGKFLFRDFQVDKQLLESVDDAKRASTHIFDSKLESTKRWFKGMSDEQQTNFFDSMYKGTGKEGVVKALKKDPIVQDRIDRWLAQGTYKGRSSIADRLAKYSKLFEEDKIPNWFPLIDRRFAEQAIKLELPKTLEPASRAFLKERTLLGEHISDPIMSIAIRRTQIAIANLQDKVYQNVIDKGLGGVKTFKTAADAELAGYERLTSPLMERIKRTLLEGKADIKLPVGEHYVTKDFARQYKGLMYDQSVHVPVLSYLTHQWKSHVTSNIAFPSYFARNFTSNIVQNAMKIGGHAIDPVKNSMAFMMVTGKGLKTAFKTDIGENLTLGGVLKEAEEMGIMGKGQFIADLGGTTLDPKAQSTWSWFLNQVNIMDPDKFALTRVGRKFGAQLENQAKLVNYMTWRAKGLSPKIAAMEATEALFDYSQITKGEQWAKLVIPFYCVPVSHEILTRNGWKYYDQIKVGDECLTYQHDTGDMEWQTIDDIAVFDFEGELRKFERKNAEFLFTDDHRWPVITSKTFVKGNWYGGERKVKRAFELNTSDNIPLTGEFRSTQSILSPRHAAILGWVVTDGYHRWIKNYCEMVVYQHPKKFLNEIVELLGTTPRAPHPDTGTVCVPVKLEDMRVLTEFFKSKDDLPKIVCDLSREAAEAMWMAMYKADGTIKYLDSDQGQMTFAKQEDQQHVRDAFQILSTLTGRSTRATPRGINVLRSTTLKVSEGIKSEVYKGKIWCPKTKNGTWVMRHNGAVIITGNTFTKKNLELSAKVFAQRPAILAGQLKAIRDIGPTEAEWDSLPAWARNKFVFRFREQFQQGLGLPLEDIMELVDAPSRQFILRSNPVFRAPIERLAGVDFFSKRPLIDVRNAKEFTSALDTYEDSRTPAALKAAIYPIVKFLDLTRDTKTDKVVGDPNRLHLLRSSFTSRYQSVLGLLKDDEKDSLEKALRWGLGFVVLDSNPELNRNIKNRDIDNKMMEKFQRKNMIRVLRRNIPVGGEPGVKQKIIDLQKRTEKADTDTDRQMIMDEADQLIDEER